MGFQVINSLHSLHPPWMKPWTFEANQIVEADESAAADGSISAGASRLKFPGAQLQQKLFGRQAEDIIPPNALFPSVD
jgi:hypothetical protein